MLFDKPPIAAGDGQVSPRARSRTRTFLLAAVATIALGGAAAFIHSLSGGPARSALSTTFAAPASTSTIAPASIAPAGFPSLADLVEKVRPAVVSVRVRTENEAVSLLRDGGPSPFEGSPFERFFRGFPGEGQGAPSWGGEPRMGPRAPKQYVEGQGSGFFISPDGYIVTNNHVIDKAVRVEVVTDTGKKLEAKVVGRDPATDLALLKIDDGSNLPYVKLADASPRVGDWVIAMGNPFGLGGTVTAGIVSAMGRDIGSGPLDNFLQIDAPVNRGNSGGPTFNVNGEVIGVNTAIYSPSGGSIGIAFAVPASTVKSVISQLKEDGRVDRGWLGVEIQPVTDDIANSLGLKSASGALVAAVQPGSPAAKAGLMPGDVIKSVDGTEIKDARALARTINMAKPNSKVSLTIVRDGKTETAAVVLDAQKQASLQPSPHHGDLE